MTTPSEVITIPNQFTVYGMQRVLKAAFWNEKVNWYMGLCARNPDDFISMDSLNEPTIGVNGYQRQLVPMTAIGWPEIGVVNSESYVESLPFSFTAVGGSFDKLINRLFFTDGDYVLSVSAAMPGGLRAITNSTYSSQYRLFFK